MIDETPDTKPVLQGAFGCHRVQTHITGRIPNQIQDHNHSSPNPLLLHLQHRRIVEEGRGHWSRRFKRRSLWCLSAKEHDLPTAFTDPPATTQHRQ